MLFEGGLSSSTPTDLFIETVGLLLSLEHPSCFQTLNRSDVLEKLFGFNKQKLSPLRRHLRLPLGDGGKQSWESLESDFFGVQEKAFSPAAWVQHVLIECFF